MIASRVLSRLTTAALVLGIGAFSFAGWRAYAERRGPTPVQKAAGDPERVIAAEQRLPPAALLSTVYPGDSSGGHPRSETPARVVYVFHSRCPACIAQHAHMGRLLQSVRQYGVRTVSTEPLSEIRDYWEQVGAALPPPMEVSSDALASARILGVPSVLFLRSDGMASRAWVGSMRAWTEDRFHKELRMAIRSVR